MKDGKKEELEEVKFENTGKLAVESIFSRNETYRKMFELPIFRKEENCASQSLTNVRPLKTI